MRRRKGAYVDWTCVKVWILQQLLLQEQEEEQAAVDVSETRQEKCSRWNSRVTRNSGCRHHRKLAWTCSRFHHKTAQIRVITNLLHSRLSSHNVHQEHLQQQHDKAFPKTSTEENSSTYGQRQQTGNDQTKFTIILLRISPHCQSNCRISNKAEKNTDMHRQRERHTQRQREMKKKRNRRNSCGRQPAVAIIGKEDIGRILRLHCHCDDGDCKLYSAEAASFRQLIVPTVATRCYVLLYNTPSVSHQQQNRSNNSHENNNSSCNRNSVVVVAAIWCSR